MFEHERCEVCFHTDCIGLSSVPDSMEHFMIGTRSAILAMAVQHNVMNILFL